MVLRRGRDGGGALRRRTRERQPCCVRRALSVRHRRLRPSVHADDATRDDGPTPEARQSAADVSEPEPDYEQPARRAGQRDDVVSNSGARAICPSSTASEIVPRTDRPGGDAADDECGEAVRRALQLILSRPATSAARLLSAAPCPRPEPRSLCPSPGEDSSTTITTTRPVRPYAASATCLSGATEQFRLCFISALSPFLGTWSLRPWAIMDCRLVHILFIYGTVGILYLKTGMV